MYTLRLSHNYIQKTYCGCCHQHRIFSDFMKAFGGCLHETRRWLEYHYGPWSELETKRQSSYIIAQSLATLPSRCFPVLPDTRLQFSPTGADAGEFLVVTFSWEKIGPAQKHSCRLVTRRVSTSFLS